MWVNHEWEVVSLTANCLCPIWCNIESGDRAMAPIRFRAFICNSAVIGGIPACKYTASFAVRSGRDSSCFNVLRWYLSRASRWDFLNINVSSPYMQRGTTYSRYSCRITIGLEPLLPWKPAPIRAYDARRAVDMHCLMMVEFDLSWVIRSIPRCLQESTVGIIVSPSVQEISCDGFLPNTVIIDLVGWIV